MNPVEGKEYTVLGKKTVYVGSRVIAGAFRHQFETKKGFETYCLTTTEIRYKVEEFKDVCLRCGEKVEKQDLRIPEGIRPMHTECHIRTIVGSVAHQQKRCFCYGGDGEDDPQLTSRQAAFAACQYWYSQQKWRISS